MVRQRGWIAAAAGAALGVVLGAGAVVMAQTPGRNGGNPTFLDRVAQKIGIQTPKLQDAMKGAANDEVDAAVQRGDLTQQQAEHIKQRIAQSNGDFFPGPHFGPDFPSARHGFGPAPGAEIDELASFLGITPDQLRSDLREDGTTLTSVAQKHGKTRDQLKSFILDEAKSRLSAAVQNGNLTQKQAGGILSMLQQHVDQLVDHPFPKCNDMPYVPGMGAGATPGADSSRHARPPLSQFHPVTSSATDG